MSLQKKDFIEIEFTAKTKEGNIFDSNIKEDLEKLDPSRKRVTKPFIFCLGEGMFLKGVENFLIGKPSKPASYKIELSPENAFGNRDSKLIQKIPTKVFSEQKLKPIPGIMFNFDGRIAKVLAVSGGRVIVDFNNPIAGKDVIYEVKLLRKIEDLNEKIRSFNEFLFKKNFKFNIEKNKLSLEVDEPLIKFVEMFKDKFKEIFGLDLEVKKIEPAKKQEKIKEVVKK